MSTVESAAVVAFLANMSAIGVIVEVREEVFLTCFACSAPLAGCDGAMRKASRDCRSISRLEVPKSDTWTRGRAFMLSSRDGRSCRDSPKTDSVVFFAFSRPRRTKLDSFSLTEGSRRGPFHSSLFRSSLVVDMVCFRTA